MQPLAVFALVIAGSVAGLFIFTGAKISFKNIIPTASLSSFFLFSTAVFQASGFGSWIEVLLAIVFISSILWPVAAKVMQEPVQTSLQLIFVRLVLLYLLVAAVIRALNEVGLHPVLLAGYGVAAIVNAKKIGSTASGVLTTVVSLTSLYAAAQIPIETIPPEILTPLGPAILLALASAPKPVLEKADSALNIILYAAIIFVFSGVFLSPFVESEISFNGEISIDVFIVLAIVFGSVGLVGKKSSFNLSDALVFAAASALAFAGPSFHQSLAQMLTPLTGVPLVNLSSQILKNVMQFFGLAAVFALLKGVVELSSTIPLKIKKEGSFPTQVFATGAVAFAILASVSTDLVTLLSLAGSIHFVILSALLPFHYSKKKIFVPSTTLYIVAANIILLHVFTETEAAFLLNVLNIPKIAVLTVSAAAVPVGAWMFAENFSKMPKKI